MQSGVSVDPQCIQEFNTLKLGKSLKWIIYKISDNGKEITVDDKGTDSDWEMFRKKLVDAKAPRYAVYDVEFDVAGAGKRNKITFISWSPDDAGIKPKMIYSSSKEALKRSLNGIATEVQANDEEDIEHGEIIKKVSSGVR